MGNIEAERKIKYLDGGGQSYNPSTFTFGGITSLFQVVTDPGAGFLFLNPMHCSMGSTSTGEIDIDIGNRHWRFTGVADIKADEGLGNTNYEIALYLNGAIFPESMQKLQIVGATQAGNIYPVVCKSISQYMSITDTVDMRMRRSAGTGNTADFKTMTIQAWMD